MGDLADAVAAADSVWAVTAIFFIGIYVLLWKYGGEMLKLARENNKVVKDTRSETQAISSNIITNHGSKNLGDSVDRLTEWMAQHMREGRTNAETIRSIRTDLTLHLSEVGPIRERLEETLAEVDERLSALEKKEQDNA
jgi:hypothetical protein